MLSPLLAGLTPAQVHEVIAGARVRSFKRGTVLFHQGDPGISIHIIRTGHVVLRVTTPQGQSSTLRVFGPGDVFGRAALPALDGVRQTTSVALDACETYELSMQQIAEMRVRYPLFNDALLTNLAKELAITSERLIDVTFVDAATRVRKRLAELTAKFEQGPTGWEVSVTQEDLAGLASTSRGTVNRVLVGEEKRGTISLKRGGIVIVDRERLNRPHGREPAHRLRIAASR